jgi:phosphate transport system permease protein
MTTVQSAVSGLSSGGSTRKIKNSVATVVMTACFLIALIPLVWLMWTVIDRGYSVLGNIDWFTKSQRGETPTAAGGGAFHAIIGTLEQVAVTTVISVPIAIMVAVYLVEYGVGRLARLVTFMVDILTGIPSIVAALFIFAVFLSTFGAGFAGIWASLALVLLMIPVIVRTTEEMLKLVPNELREAAYALGVPKWRTILRVVLPTAFTGITTGVVLGIARVAGETAPLLILDKYAQGTNYNPFSSFQGALPTMIRDGANNLGATHALNSQGQIVNVHNYAADRMWGAALTLIVIVMLLNILARLIARRNKVAQ